MRLSLSSKKRALCFIVLLIISFTLLLSSKVAYGEEQPFKRLAGKTCFDTATQISNEGFESSDTVIIATMDGYWDALSASALAGCTGSPILFTNKDSLTEETQKELERLNAQNIIIVGGKAAVSDAVKSTLIESGFNVSRIAGATAVDTANEIASVVQKKDAGKTCIIATSKGYYDALSVAPIAYNKRIPLYLTDYEGNLKPSIKNTITENYTDAIIVGGSDAVSGATQIALENSEISVMRLAGENAWQTSSAIAQYALETIGMTPSHIGIADGNGYWDALTGACLCGLSNSPLVLVPHDGPNCDGYTFSFDSQCIDDIIVPNASKIDLGYIYGGTAVVSSTTEKLLNDIVNKTDRTFTVTYTDGLDEEIFENQVFEANRHDPTPVFEGTPVREGYTFEGWNPAVSKTVTANTTYVAQWKEITYTVVYTDGVDDEIIFEDQIFDNLEKDSKTPLFDSVPEREGYEFAGWNLEIADTVTADVTYIALWNPIYTGSVYGVKIPRNHKSVCIKTYDNEDVDVSNSRDEYENKKHQSVFAHEDVLVSFHEGQVVIEPISDKNEYKGVNSQGENVDVFVKTPVLYYSFIEDIDRNNQYDEFLLSDTKNPGFKRIPGNVYTDQEGNDCMLYAKYPASITVEVDETTGETVKSLRSVSGARCCGTVFEDSSADMWSWDSLKRIEQSMNEQTEEQGPRLPYTMRVPADDWYLKAMFLMKYGTKDSQYYYSGNHYNENNEAPYTSMTGTLDNRYSDGSPSPKSGKHPYLIQGIECGLGVSETFSMRFPEPTYYNGADVQNNANRFDGFLTVNLQNAETGKFLIDCCYPPEKDWDIIQSYGYTNSASGAGLFCIFYSWDKYENWYTGTRISLNNVDPLTSPDTV